MALFLTRRDACMYPTCSRGLVFLISTLSCFVWLVPCYFIVNLIVCFQVGISFYLFSLPIFLINCLILIKLYWKWCKDCGSDSSVSKRSTGGWRRIWILDSVVSCLHKATHGVGIVPAVVYRPYITPISPRISHLMYLRYCYSVPALRCVPMKRLFD